MRPLALVLLAALAVPVGAQSAEASRAEAPSPETSWVRVQAEAGVVVVGEQTAAPGEWLAVAPGDQSVALVDDLRAWNPRRATQEIVLAPGDSATLALVLPRRVRVETLPIRALVVRQRADGTRDTLGTAPLDLDLAPGERADLVATLDGYSDARATTGDGRVTLMLSPEPGAVAEVTMLPTERSTARRTLIDVGIGVAVVAAGAVAVHYKFRADDLDDRYRSDDPADRGDAALRDEALRLDRYSVVALGAMQVGLGALALRFALR